MSRASTHLCRKRSRDDAHGGASPTRRRRRRLAPSPFPAVRSFGLRIAVASAPQRLRKRRHDENTSWARICRSRSSCPISPSPSPAVRPFSIRVALATSPRRRRKSRVDDARLPVSTPRRRRSLLSRVKRFPGLRPFALRFLLAAGASAPRCRRNVTTVNNGGSEVHRERLEGSPEVVDLTLEKDLELEKVDVVSRGIGDWRLPALESPTPPEKRALFHKEALEWTKRRGGKLQESGFEVRLQEVKHAEIPSMLVHRSKEDLSELFTPLTDKDEREVNTLLCDSGYSDKIIVMHGPSNIELTKEKLECLRPRGWLNDEAINLYIELLKERAEREPKRFLKCHFFNTFFYKKHLAGVQQISLLLNHCQLTCGIAGYDYQSVRRWTTLKKLGYTLIECEKIFIPVHRDIHWCLAVINMKDKTLQYLDSLGGLGHDVLRVLARYIMDELKDKSNIEIDTTSWMVEVSDCLPLQHNGWDCGMFMLKYIDFHSRGLKPSFRQEHMMYFRKRTAKEIVRLRAD